MQKLQQEIQSHFKSYDTIASASALQLPYLQAVINEGLRIYPPASQGLPRISPGAFVDGVWIPAEVRHQQLQVIYWKTKLRFRRSCISVAGQ